MSDTKSVGKSKARGRFPGGNPVKNNLARDRERENYNNTLFYMSQWKGQRAHNARERRAHFIITRVTHLLAEAKVKKSVCVNVNIRTCAAKTPHAERVSSRTKRGACGANDCLHPTNSTLPTRVRRRVHPS